MKRRNKNDITSLEKKERKLKYRLQNRFLKKVLGCKNKGLNLTFFDLK